MRTGYLSGGPRYEPAEMGQEGEDASSWSHERLKPCVMASAAARGPGDPPVLGHTQKRDQQAVPSAILLMYVWPG